MDNKKQRLEQRLQNLLFLLSHQKDLRGNPLPPEELERLQETYQKVLAEYQSLPSPISPAPE